MSLFISIASLVIALILYTKLRDFPLYILRVLALVLALVFATDFALTALRGGGTSVLLLVDASRSMGIPSKSEWVDDKLQELSEIEGLELETLGFHGEIQEYEPADISYGEMTDISGALSMTDRAPVLLISDGLHNIPGNPVKAAEGREHPVHVLLPRNLPEERNAAISEVESDRVILEGGQARIRAAVTAEGSGTYNGTLSLLESERILETRSLSIPGGESSTLSFEISPENLGPHYYELRLEEWTDESFTGDNTRDIGIEVIRGLYQAVVLSTHPSPEMSALRRLFTRFPRLDVRFVVRGPEGDWAEWGRRVSSFDDRGLRADFVVLIDPNPEALALAEELCHEKDRFIVLLGSGARSVASSLGLMTRETPWIQREIDLTPTSFLLNLISERSIEGLSPLHAAISVHLPEGAIPLLVSNSIRTETGPYPLLSLLRESDREIVLGTGLGFWQLSHYSPDAYGTLLGGLVTYFMRQHNEFFSEVEKKVYFTGEPVRVRAYSYDETGDPLEDVFVRICFGNDTLPLRYKGPGEFESSPLFFGQGEREIEVLFWRGDQLLAAQSLRFRVREGSLEAAETGADTVLLREIAGASGGRVLEHVRDLLEVDTERRANAFFLKPNTLLPFLLLFIGIHTLEGWLRKRRGLL
jgi:hypothetical protein